MMRVLALEDAYGIDHLKIAERPSPKPAPGQIVVKMRAASLNYRDLATVEASFAQGRLPFVPLSDGCGVVAEIGPGVSRVKAGDRVTPLFFQDWLAGAPTRRALSTALGGALDGVAQEEMLLDEDGVTPAPANLSDEEAACLPCAALTAWRALMVEGAVKPGDVVLTQGTGGVSIFALQFAKAAGARVIITSSSDDKLERARSLGADHTINYRTTPDWAKAARDLTGGQGADHVIEVGGAQTFAQSLQAVRLGGRIAVIGVLTGMAQNINVAAMFAANARIHGITVGSREMFEDMTRAIESLKIRPVVDRRFTLEQAPAAFKAMKAGEHFGKIVLTF
jgi:NADPH:quinone reductase-like Zn-dependent oxidoreductase